MNLARHSFGIVDCLRGGLSSGSLRICAAAIAVAMVSSLAVAQITIPSDNLGTDGSLNPFQNRLITLGSAVTGQWDQAGTGFGVYDAEKWAVVYKYNSVTIPAGVTVTFANHPSGAPVVWLVSGDVTINGTVNLNGSNSVGGEYGYPFAGPGGFRGGQSLSPSSSGFGPGGGNGVTNAEEGGGFGTFGSSVVSGDVGGYVYGTADLIPIIGGSGGGARPGAYGGGGGGGAILIVATGTISVNGFILANGGSSPADFFGNGGGGGSGGAIRLVANTITGSASGSLQCIGGTGYAGGRANGGYGRIRTESNLDTLPADGIPSRSRATVGTTAILWPDATKPKITNVSLGDKPVPSDPRGLFTFGNTDVELNATTPAQLTIQAQNVPLNATLEVRIVPVTQSQGETRLNASFQSGTLANSNWRATLPVTNGVSSITVSVIMP